jgi:site-specific recombinase XerD
MVDAPAYKFSPVRSGGFDSWGLRLPGETPPAYRSLLEPFTSYLRVEKGLSEGTIQTRHWYVEDFLGWFFRDHNSLRQITITDVDEAMARKGHDDGYARLSVRVYASSLRSFLRYLRAEVGAQEDLPH